VSDYNRLNAINLRYKWRSNTAYSIGDVVLPSDGIDNDVSHINNNGRYYICTVAGTSRSALPLPGWTVTTPPTAGLEITDGTGTLRWREWGYVWKASTSYPANAIVVPAINNGHYYKGPSSPNPFISGTSEPTRNTSGTQSDGTVTWTEAGTILDTTATTDNIKNYLDTYLTTNAGRYDPNGNGYTVVSAETKFIQFDGTNTQVNAGASGTSSENNILKVTIKGNDPNSNETLTELFTIR
jgi:glutamine cyclotransferase